MLGVSYHHHIVNVKDKGGLAEVGSYMGSGMLFHSDGRVRPNILQLPKSVA